MHGSYPPPDLYAHLTDREAERGLLEEYRIAAEKSPSKALRYLINLLIEDEIRHRRIFAELVESVHTTEAQQTVGEGDAAEPAEPIVPNIDFSPLDPTDQAAIVDLTEKLLQKERQDEQELKRLQREFRDVKDTTLWSLLVDLMVRDTQTHMAILTFARKHAGRRGR